MRFDPPTFNAPPPETAMPWATESRRHRGRRSYHSGLAAEDCVARQYADRGGQCLERRHRTPHGEIDLIVCLGGMLVFVEVKKRTRLHAWDTPISAKQWERLKNSALHYILAPRSKTDVHPIIRFDVALVGRDGQVQIIENARSFDEH